MSNNNPIENAHRAVSDNNEAVKKEAATLAYADWYLQENSDKKSGESAQKYVEDALKLQGLDTTGLMVFDNGTIITNAPTIPNGFKYLEGTVETGFVIKNSTDKNEFVWVPVEKGTFYTVDGYSLNWDTGVFELENFVSSDNVYEPYEEEGYTSEREEYDAMVESVEKYGGFYIARYEASDNGSGKAQSLPNKTPWNNIAWGTSTVDITGGAVEAARAVYPVSNATVGDAVSTLPYGVEWDAVIKFIETNYPGISQDSLEYGNYSICDKETGEPIYEASMINTGSNSDYAINNIYDIAGNLQEWTMECDGYGRYSRGGNFYDYDFVISSRVGGEAGGYCDYEGFRIALYIK